MLPVKKTSLFTSCFVIAYKTLAMNVYYLQMRKKSFKKCCLLSKWFIRELVHSQLRHHSGNTLQGTQPSLLTGEIHGAVMEWHLSFCHRTSIWVTWPRPSNTWLLSCCKGFPFALGLAARDPEGQRGLCAELWVFELLLQIRKLRDGYVKGMGNQGKWSNFTITPWT